MLEIGRQVGRVFCNLAGTTPDPKIRLYSLLLARVLAAIRSVLFLMPSSRYGIRFLTTRR